MIDYGNQRTLDNIMLRLDLICAESSQVAAPGMFYYFGFCFGCAFLTNLADKYGRKWPFNIASFIGILSLVIPLILVSNIDIPQSG